MGKMPNDALTASFGLDIAPLTQSLKRATSAVSDATAKMGKGSFRDLIAPIAEVAAAVGSVAAIMEGMKGGLDLGKQMQLAHEETGIAVGQLVMLRKAAMQAGMEFEEIPKTVFKMQNAIGEALGGGEKGRVFNQLGLDPKMLATIAPDDALRKIGVAVMHLDNLNDRARVLKEIFGRGGSEMARFFNSPEMKQGTKMTSLAKVLDEYSALFKEIGEKMEKIGQHLKEFFVGLDKTIMPSIGRMLDKLEGFDFEKWGENFGNSIVGIIGDFKNRIIAIKDALKAIFLGVIPPFANALFVIFTEVASFLGEKISSSVKYAYAGTPIGTAIGSPSYDAVAKENIAKNQENLFKNLSDMMKAGTISEKDAALQWRTALMHNKGEDVRGYRAIQDTTTFESLSQKASEAIKKGVDDANPAFVDFQNALSRLMAPIPKLQQENNLQAKEAKEEADSYIPHSGIAAIGVANPIMGIIADSLAKVGGGGFAVGPGSNPILEENKRQTSLLQSINQGILRAAAASGPLEAQFSIN